MASPAEYLFPTSLKWSANGELSDLEKRAITAHLMASEKRPFVLPQTKPMTYVALITNQTGASAHVYGNANSWSNFVDQLEELGYQVIENQTSEWEGEEQYIKHDCLSILDLMRLPDTVPST